MTANTMVETDHIQGLFHVQRDDFMPTLLREVHGCVDAKI